MLIRGITPGRRQVAYHWGHDYPIPKLHVPYVEGLKQLHGPPWRFQQKNIAPQCAAPAPWEDPKLVVN
ncbi:hypothetical protein GCM10007981_01330 [Thermocladium modestius]|uniref:Uncharacterized protein n=1 Tax=Thermocladium modestius TaxID=62609 RepID=A0A830GVF7_9CREN|nr:hypothetical protein GCM10007981_01330 [Thermocladium modestius]